MATRSTDAGSSLGRRDLRDRPLFRLLALGAVLLAGFLVTRGCAATDRPVSPERATEVARAAVDFTPDRVQVRFVQRGIPVRGFWAVSLYTLDEDGRPDRIVVVLIDARSGDVVSEFAG